MAAKILSTRLNPMLDFNMSNEMLRKKGFVLTTSKSSTNAEKPNEDAWDVDMLSLYSHSFSDKESRSLQQRAKFLDRDRTRAPNPVAKLLAQLD